MTGLVQDARYALRLLRRQPLLRADDMLERVGDLLEVVVADLVRELTAILA